MQTGATAPFFTAETEDVPRLERLCRAITSLSSKVGNDDDDAGEVDHDGARDCFRELDEMANITLQEFRRRYGHSVVSWCFNATWLQVCVYTSSLTCVSFSAILPVIAFHSLQSLTWHPPRLDEDDKEPRKFASTASQAEQRASRAEVWLSYPEKASTAQDCDAGPRLFHQDQGPAVERRCEQETQTQQFRRRAPKVLRKDFDRHRKNGQNRGLFLRPGPRVFEVRFSPLVCLVWCPLCTAASSGVIKIFLQ